MHVMMMHIMIRSRCQSHMHPSGSAARTHALQGEPSLSNDVGAQQLLLARSYLPLRSHDVRHRVVIVVRPLAAAVKDARLSAAIALAAGVDDRGAPASR
eukprot:CAMPEP_0115833108 /NCGR_PEP_ID=MMETSP0287-20121206/3003_1 /TAXON_ID=412157 /ORGANISM="Chrysochromulina rotalis, Strain UIO044" /LENGTH=98 /DNA_ID=CAMNT_0003286513 /DNA_START=247 /DNA_END=540 /DNA_ORIENTATION=-